MLEALPEGALPGGQPPEERAGGRRPGGGFAQAEEAAHDGERAALKARPVPAVKTDHQAIAAERTMREPKRSASQPPGIWKRA